MYATVAGTLILSFGVAVFCIPFRLVAGGVTGLAIVFSSLFPLKYITPEVWIALFSWGLFVLGWIILGAKFSLKTLVSTAVYPFGISLFSSLLSTEAVEALYRSLGAGWGLLFLVFSAAAGGALVGTGCALILRGGGSSGGTDVLALILCRYFPRLKSATAILMVDALIILIGAAVSSSPLLSLLGILHAVICASVIRALLYEGQ